MTLNEAKANFEAYFGVACLPIETAEHEMLFVSSEVDQYEAHRWWAMHGPAAIRAEFLTPRDLSQRYRLLKRIDWIHLRDKADMYQTAERIAAAAVAWAAVVSFIALVTVIW